MKFGEAMTEVMGNKAIARRAWEDGKSIVRGKFNRLGTHKVHDCIIQIDRSGARFGWAPSQEDMFADDWRIVGGEGA